MKSRKQQSAFTLQLILFLLNGLLRSCCLLLSRILLLLRKPFAVSCSLLALALHLLLDAAQDFKDLAESFFS